MFSAVSPVPRMVPGPEWVLNKYLWKDGMKERNKERDKERRKGKKEGREEKMEGGKKEKGLYSTNIY